jgi:predicted nucleotide-binding protein (sugar kinase/HSP70/actin superfamily)
MYTFFIASFSPKAMTGENLSAIQTGFSVVIALFPMMWAAHG